MKKTWILDNPIQINNKTVTSLEYDPMEITAGMYVDACSRCAGVNKNGMSLKLKESDYALHFYLGAYAVIAVNPDVDISDLERVKGYDSLTLTDIGRLFILRRSAEPSKESSSDAQSEITQEHSTHQSEI